MERLERSGGPDYASYLLIDDLLGLQRPLTEGAHDELLFIVVHQSYELWFKLILHELGRAREELLAGRPQAAIPRLRRIATIEGLLLHHLEVLETMSPEGFLEFRDPLEPASGFQSVQFRAHRDPRAPPSTTPSAPPRSCPRSARRGWRRSRTSTATTRATPRAPRCTRSPSCCSTTTRGSRAGARTTC